MLNINTIVQKILPPKEKPKIEKVTVREFLSYQKSDEAKYNWACSELTKQGLNFLATYSKSKNLSCADTKDLVQDSMEALIRKVSTKKMDIEIAAYFKGICRNKAIDMLNNSKRKSTISGSEESETYLLNMSDKGRTLDELTYKLFYNEIIEIFERNLNRRKNFNNHDCIELLKLRREGYKHSEIDEHMGKQDWSKQRQRRCFKKIRDILGIVERKVTVKK